MTHTDIRELRARFRGELITPGDAAPAAEGREAMGTASTRCLRVELALLAVCVLLGVPARAQHYTQTNLVSDQAGTPVTDPDLLAPWGLARSSVSVWLSANNRTGTATLYDGNSGAPAPFVVTIPPAAPEGDHGVPTAAVFNGTSAFEVAPGFPARFLFATQDGSISAWNPAVSGTQAVVKVTSPGAVYTGAAIALREGEYVLYAANFAAGRIEAFDSGFRRVHPARAPRLVRNGLRGRAFRDSRIPRGFAPFNVQNIGGDLYVTFARRDPVTDVAGGSGFGYVDVFSPGGLLLRRLEHGPWLDAPWGVALAPGDFGAFSHNLLVGQFRSGEIAAYDVATGAFLGLVLRDSGAEALVVEGLRALSFGNGATAGPLNALFFTAGTGDQGRGLLGTLTAVPAEQLLGNGN